MSRLRVRRRRTPTAGCEMRRRPLPQPEDAGVKRCGAARADDAEAGGVWEKKNRIGGASPRRASAHVLSYQGPMGV